MEKRDGGGYRVTEGQGGTGREERTEWGGEGRTLTDTRAKKKKAMLSWMKGLYFGDPE
jgi:hypothetical protein